MSYPPRVPINMGYMSSGPIRSFTPRATISKPPVVTNYPAPVLQVGPPVTVFVGNITDKWPDPMIRQLLATCGQVVNWRRVQGASGKLQGFGFCEFNGPDTGLRAVRLLHDLEVGDKKLVVKVDAKNNSVLEDFKGERRKKLVKETGVEPPEGEYMDQEMRDADARSKARIDIIFREFKNELESYEDAVSKDNKDTVSASKQVIQDKLHLLKLSSLSDPLPPVPGEGDEEDDNIDESKRDIISREIVNFRENMKQQERQREEDRKKRERREREERKRREIDDVTSPEVSVRNRRISPPVRRSRDRDSRRSRDRDNDRDRDRKRDRDSRRGRSRSRDRILRSPPSSSKTRFREREEEEEMLEQKRQERKTREKEAAYLEKLRAWEARETQRAREFKKLKDKLKRQEEETQREAKKMKQFLEDYDDDAHDPKYYKGKELQKRLAERAKELEGDNKDRQKEREELEDLKLRMLTGTAPPPLIDKYKKAMAESINLSPTPFKILSKDHQAKVTTPASISPAITTTPISQSPKPAQFSSFVPIKVNESPPLEQFNNNNSNSSTGIATNNNNNTSATTTTSNSSSKASGLLKGFQLSLNAGKAEKSEKSQSAKQEFDGSLSVSPVFVTPRQSDDDSRSPLQTPDMPSSAGKKKIDVKDVFNQDDDDADGMGRRKRKLVPLDDDFGDGEHKRSKKDKDSDKNPEEKKKHIKTLIDKIPTDKEDLFSYAVDWDMVDNTLMEKRIRPWINKKIVEYIGEPEPTLVDFICSKVLGRSAPQHILDDVMMVLDEEAEVFVLKMWRLLVYEIEAKKLGVTKPPQ